MVPPYSTLDKPTQKPQLWSRAGPHPHGLIRHCALIRQLHHNKG